VECGKHLKIQKSHISASGSMENLMDLEFILIMLEIDIRDSFIMDLNRDTGLKDFSTEIYMLVILSKV
jgi:hypothetical protein